MPRKLRQFEVGNIYHIINRGVDGRKIFLKDQDYSRFILSLEFFNNDKLVNIYDFIGKTEKAIAGSDPAIAFSVIGKKLKEERGKPKNPIVELMVFALMPNHYHLAVKEIVRGGISFYMQKIGGYSGYFNKQHERKGTLFGSRYSCVKIESDAQLFAVFNYIHTNPVELIEPMWKEQKVKNFNKAKEFLENYKWSSYGDYIGISNFPNVTNREFFLNFFGGETSCKKEAKDWIKFKADNYIQEKKFNPKNFE